MWRRIRNCELYVKWKRLEDHGDGRCTMTTVWSRDGTNLLRRDEHYDLTVGKWVSRTVVYFGRTDELCFRPRGVRHAVCCECDARCCRDPYTTVVLSVEEIGAVGRGELDWPVVRNSVTTELAKKPDGSCVFLTKTNRCGIYKKRRPVGCRVWFCGKHTEDDDVWRKISTNMGIAA